MKVFIIFILIVALFFYALRGILRSVGRIILGPNNGRDTRQAPYNRPQNRKEGDIQIDRQHKEEKHINANVGEYVDYEEVK